MTRRVLLWRHGRTAWNAENRFQGQLDPPLDEVGLDQALEAARVIAGLSPTAVLSSDLLRATQTAQALAVLTGLAVVPDTRLRELHLGLWQGLTRTEVEERFPEDYATWSTGADLRRGDNGETYAEVALRSAGCVRQAAAELPPDGLLVVVVHGGTARAVIGDLLELDPLSWWRMGPLGNCCWSVLSQAGRGWRLAEHGVGVQEHARLGESPDTEPSAVDA